MLDTNVFIAAKNKNDPFYSESIMLIEAVDEGRLRCIVSTLIIAELCVGYYQEDDEEGLNELLTALLTTPSYEVIPITDEIACKAGKIRSELALKLPDAIIVATAISTGVNLIVTYDDGLRKAEKYIPIRKPAEIKY
ncbi:MAG: PIN domain-containing protein [Nitrososphaeria archaeon]|nr:PIN domain-containing protein [Nitrososphaeria archaeon]